MLTCNIFCGVLQCSQLPVPDGLLPSPMLAKDNVNRLTKEGGDSLVSLCSHAISFVESSNAPNYQEWSYHNILKLPTDEQALWQKACETELSMLKECKVWEVTNYHIDLSPCNGGTRMPAKPSHSGVTLMILTMHGSLGAPCTGTEQRHTR